MKILVVDIGGSHVKFLATGLHEVRRFDSQSDLTPQQLVKRVKSMTVDWEYRVVSLGFPGEVGPGGPKAEPGNLGDGWVGFDYQAAFGKPVRVVNDAAMQALGAYTGGRMLFLGLGTGLGSALVVDRVLIPMELGRLKLDTVGMLSDQLGRDGLKRLGEEAWSQAVVRAVGTLQDALAADYVVLGGGHADRVNPLPDGCRCGGNDDAFAGGFLLWEGTIEPHDQPPSSAWRIVG